MDTNLYLLEQLARQQHQELIDQAALERMLVQLHSTRRSLAEHMLHGIRRRLSPLNCWLPNRTQHEQPAPEA
jgi:hypothetical protein